MRCLSPKDNNFYICLLQKTTMATYLQVDNLTKSYGDRVLFNKISFHINQGDKVALVAPNGSGKTSLLDVLAGKESPEGEGTIKFMSGIQVAYLEQDPSYDPELTVLEQVRSADEKVMQTLTAYKQALESEDKKRLEKAINDMDRLDGWNYDQKIERILTHLQFGAVDRKMGTLSGGEIKKVALAGMLIQEAPFMILDEPTNHLDIEVIEYLEDYMSATQATLFMVTHDRYFLDRVCNTIYELENGELFTYRGNYSLFLEKREERLANRAAETDKARNLYRRELQWIRSTPCARTGKSKSRLESFGKLKERIGPAGNTRSMEINAGIARLGTKIIHARNLSFTYGEEPLLKDFTYNFSRNEKIGIVGGNGVGKTTFLRLLAGELEPDEIRELADIETRELRQLRERILQCRRRRRKVSRRLQALRDDKTARLWRKAHTLDDKNEDWWTAVRRDLETARERLEREVADLERQVEAAGLVDESQGDMKNG